MFTTPEHAKKLLSANERIVRLSLADSQRTSLYVHPAFLKASSSVLCDMLDAVDSGLDSADISINAYYTIPLSDTNVKTWTTVLSIICPSAEPFKITWSNVMDLLLVAHKYDMPAVTGEYKSPQSLACCSHMTLTSLPKAASKQSLGHCAWGEGPRGPAALLADAVS
jgi:hypothetical protein